ncbi:MAG TPA: HU family DNA-binding protein [Lacunisphaera sp.]|nr:HU family DNA-binding protein [Lacunisphaera sp.]
MVCGCSSLRRKNHNPRPTMSTNLTKREIVLEIYEKTGFPQKQIQDTVQMTLDIVMDALAAGRNVELRNFGVLEVQVRKARVGRNPNKPETEVVIPERAVVKFKSGKILKQKIKQLSLEKLRNNPPPPASA